MKPRTFIGILITVFIVSLTTYAVITPDSTDVPLVGVVEGNEYILSPQISGRIVTLCVDEGVSVKKGVLIAELDRRELEASLAATKANVASLLAQVDTANHNYILTNEQTDASLDQARATLTSNLAQLDRARMVLSRDATDYGRMQQLFDTGVESLQNRDHAESTRKMDEADLAAVEHTVEAQRAAVSVALSNRRQVEVRKSELAGTRAQLEQARASEKEVETQLSYTEVYAPVDGIVSLRAATVGEFVTQGSPIVTLVDLDHLWVRADVEESYMDLIQFGQILRVMFPSGNTVEGSVFFKGVESDFATQRDVSHLKRDVRTFAIKVSLLNMGQNLFTGMTATVLLPPRKAEARFRWFQYLHTTLTKVAGNKR